MAEQAKVVMRRWFEEVWNQRREASIDELLAHDATAFGLWDGIGESAPTPELFRRFYREFLEMFPDIKVRVAQVVGEGDDVALRLECEGHYAKAPAAGALIKFGAMVFVTVREGKIVEGWNLVDESAITRQAQAAAAK
jgi:predicted SnoaL-like aldol condensation-catalyzing enzyme